MKQKEYAYEIIKDISNEFSNLQLNLMEKISSFITGSEMLDPVKLRLQISQMIRREIKALSVDKTIAKTLMSALSSNLYEIRKYSGNIDRKAIVNIVSNMRKSIRTQYNYLNALSNQMKSQIMKSSTSVANDIIAQVVSAKKDGIPIAESMKSIGDVKLSFVDSAGKSWNAQSYIEMAARTTANKLNADVSKKLSKEIDNDLRIVDALGGSCPVCYEFNDKIIGATGEPNEETLKAIEEDGFTYIGTYDDIVGQGFDHPNCRCIVNVYTVGVAEHVSSDSENKNSQNYQDRQTQRGLERKIRDQKLKKAGALNSDVAKKAQANITATQKQLAKFTKDNNLSRMRWREQLQFNVKSDGAWEKSFITGKTSKLNSDFIKDVL